MGSKNSPGDFETSFARKIQIASKFNLSLDDAITFLCVGGRQGSTEHLASVVHISGDTSLPGCRV